MNPHREAPVHCRSGRPLSARDIPAPWWRKLRALFWSRDENGNWSTLYLRGLRRGARLFARFANSAGVVYFGDLQPYLRTTTFLTREQQNCLTLIPVGRLALEGENRRVALEAIAEKERAAIDAMKDATRAAAAPQKWPPFEPWPEPVRLPEPSTLVEK